jgi:hypothetical protein
MSTLTEAPATPQAAQEYHQTIAALHSAHTVIPLRYGALFAGPEPLRAAVAHQAAAYRVLLEELAGLAEMSISVVVPRSQVQEITPPAGVGGQYLLQRAQRYGATFLPDTETERIWATLGTAWQRYVVRTVAETRAHENGYLLIRHLLIPRDRLAGLRAALQQADTPFHTTLTGPWPPYNFV